jgi:hypothetical protein
MEKECAIVLMEKFLCIGHNYYLNDRVESVNWEFINVEILIFFYLGEDGNPF